MPAHASYDAVIVGGGHNGLVAAAYLARAGRSVLVLERLGTHRRGRRLHPSVRRASTPGSPATRTWCRCCLARSCDELGLRFAVRKRTVSSYTPTGAGGLLVGRGPHPRTPSPP